MHSNVVFRNTSAVSVDEQAVEDLTRRIVSWNQKNFKTDIPVCVLVRRAGGKSLYTISYENAFWNSIKEGLEPNLLQASIDVWMQKYAKPLGGKIEFMFFVGYSEIDMEKHIASRDTSAISKEQKPRLSVSPVEPKYTLSQVILPPEVKTEIENVMVLLKNMRQIYYDWGFIDIDPVPRSIVNLWGPSGTGKTMTVHAIARELNKKILVLNYADIESKYVGDAPKNLVAAFEMAEKEDAVIFFDEADSFLGKRITNVDSGSEQAINSLRSQMLMKLEEFKGIVFFATNLHENYDQAFESRILKHIEFRMPNAEARKSIIESKLPRNAPYSAEVRNPEGVFNADLISALSELLEGFSGREIKNCVLEALVRSVQTENKCVTAEILTETCKLKKEEKEALKFKEEERRKKLSASIKKNLDEKNYNIKTEGKEIKDNE